jgi:hypothetical protein
VCSFYLHAVLLHKVSTVLRNQRLFLSFRQRRVEKYIQIWSQKTWKGGKTLRGVGMYLYRHDIEFYLKAHSLRLHWIFWLRFGLSSNLESGISLVSIQWRILWPAEGIRVSQRDCTFFCLDIVNNVYSNQHTALCHVTPHSVDTNLQIQPTDAFFSIITCAIMMDKYFSKYFVNFYSKKNIYWRSQLWEWAVIAQSV